MRGLIHITICILSIVFISGCGGGFSKPVSDDTNTVSVRLNVSKEMFNSGPDPRNVPYNGTLITEVILTVKTAASEIYSENIVQNIEQDRAVALKLKPEKLYTFEISANDSSAQRLCYGSAEAFIYRNTETSVELICYNTSDEPVIFTGVAAGGLPVLGTVSIKDSKGEVRTTTTSSTGVFTFDIKGMTAPFMLKATGFTGERAITAFAVSAGNETIINVNPYTSIAAYIIMQGEELETVFSSFSTFKRRVTLAAQDKARTDTQTIVQVFMDKLGISSFNPFNSNYEADGQGMDGVLDHAGFVMGDKKLRVINLNTSQELTTLDIFSPQVPVIPENAAENVVQAGIEATEELYNELYSFANDLVNIQSREERDYFEDGPFVFNGIPKEILLVNNHYAYHNVETEAVISDLFIKQKLSNSNLCISFKYSYEDSGEFKIRSSKMWLKKIDGQWYISGNSLMHNLNAEFSLERSMSETAGEENIEYKLTHSIFNDIEVYLKKIYYIPYLGENYDYYVEAYTQPLLLVIDIPGMPENSVRFAKTMIGAPVEGDSILYFERVDPETNQLVQDRHYPDEVTVMTPEAVLAHNDMVSEKGAAIHTAKYYMEYDSQFMPIGEPVEVKQIRNRMKLFTADDWETDRGSVFLDLTSIAESVKAMERWDNPDAFQLSEEFAALSAEDIRSGNFKARCEMTGIDEMRDGYNENGFDILINSDMRYFDFFPGWLIHGTQGNIDMKTGGLIMGWGYYFPENLSNIPAECKLSTLYEYGESYSVSNSYSYDMLYDADSELQAAYDALTFDIIKAGNASQDNITESLDFVKSINGVTVDWFTDYYIFSTASNFFYQPEYNQKSVAAAVLEFNGKEMFKYFILDIKGEKNLTQEEAEENIKNIAASITEKDILGANGSLSNITTNLSDLSSIDGVSVKYFYTLLTEDFDPEKDYYYEYLQQIPSETLYIAEDGTLNGTTCQDSEDITIALIARLEANGAAENLFFSAVIKADGGSADSNAYLMTQTLLNEYNGIDVTFNTELPGKWLCDSTLKWESLMPDIISSNGELVSKSATDTSVPFEVTFTLNGEEYMLNDDINFNVKGILSKYDENIIAAGSKHTIIKSPRFLSPFSIVFGSNGDGQLALFDGFYPVPVLATVLDDIFNVKTSNIHSAGLEYDLFNNRTDLYTWGDNTYGQIGIGTFPNYETPVKVMENVASYGVGGKFTIAVKNDGTLWAWGDNTYGQLGTGDNTASNTPVQAGTDTNWAEVSVGENHVIALKNDRTLWAWGDNTYGQLGTGDNTASNTPVQIGTANDWDRIISAYNQNFAIKKSGIVYAWGENGYGQLGTNDTEDKLLPTEALLTFIERQYDYNGNLMTKCRVNFNKINMIAPGRNHTLFTADLNGSEHYLCNTDDSDSYTFRKSFDKQYNVFGLGDNGFSQLGVSYLMDRPHPVPRVVFDTEDSALKLYIGAGENHSLIGEYKTTTGKFKFHRTGDNTFYQLGLNTSTFQPGLHTSSVNYSYDPEQNPPYIIFIE